ncbi:MAG: hypothetical protein J0I98_11465 [Mesorhizobium sp.]|nr:hypothetical protein [Mesorhizobium sp.]MBN9243402.1 hypothetical protein [Mesorhizobium sp.]
MTSRPVGSRRSDYPVKLTATLGIWFDAELGLLSVEHDGSIGWEELQAIKDHVAGAQAVAIEVYPPADRVVNNIAMRHLWVLGPGDWWPDLAREGAPVVVTLRERYLAAQIGGAA